jgi:hypothetical protein
MPSPRPSYSIPRHHEETPVIKRTSVPFLAAALLAGCAGGSPATEPPQTSPSPSPITAAPTPLATRVQSTPAPTSPLPIEGGLIVEGIPDDVMDSAVALWRHGTEVGIETADELVIVSVGDTTSVERVPLPEVPQINAIVFNDDSVWVTDHDNGQFLRVSRATGDLVATIDTDKGKAVSLLETEHGIWAGSGHTIPEGVGLIDTDTNTMGMRIDEGSFPAYGEGSLWFGRGSDSRIALDIRRIDPITGDIVSTIDLNGAQACYIGGRFPDAVWTWCLEPNMWTEMARLDVTAAEMSDSRVPLDGGGELLGVRGDQSWFWFEPVPGSTTIRLVANDTNEVVDDIELPPGGLATFSDEGSWMLDPHAAALWWFP